ncbi:hypothetical protein MCP04_23310 [Leptolyngbya boryana IU 594]|uniref:hypothetical protein n=1 Tax=Leptolyngbya boryana TaxID=1184 RepID=UPI000361829C|nr:hypothetical protein [Leptolyngbya boryana]ULP28920.1 hypothetical protein MCP04_23310 [Leptolyngbya boryana IU 594]
MLFQYYCTTCGKCGKLSDRRFFHNKYDRSLWKNFPSLTSQAKISADLAQFPTSFSTENCKFSTEAVD